MDNSVTILTSLCRQQNGLNTTKPDTKTCVRFVHADRYWYEGDVVICIHIECNKTSIFSFVLAVIIAQCELSFEKGIVASDEKANKITKCLRIYYDRLNPTIVKSLESDEFACD